VAAEVSAGGGDVGCAGESVQADGEIAQSGHHGGTGSGADLGVVFGEDDIADPGSRSSSTFSRSASNAEPVPLTICAWLSRSLPPM
jgi:hypothetical protein